MRCTVRKILRRPTIQYVTVGQDEVGLFKALDQTDLTARYSVSR